MDALDLFDRIAAVPARRTVPARAAERRELATTARQLPAAPAGPRELPEKFRLRRDEKWQFCRDVVDLCETRKLSQQQAVTLLLSTAPGRFRLIKPTYPNLRRWLGKLGSYCARNGKREYNFDNIDALADEYTFGNQPKRFDETVFKIFCGMYLTPKCVPFSACYRETKALFAREYREVKFPSPAQIRYRVKQLDPLIVNCGRYGIDYVQNHSLYMLIRDWSQVRPGQCWFADSRPFDQLIRVPDGKGGWKAARPNVTYVMDAASWFCVGFDVTGESVDNDMIRNTFARACCEHGRPEMFYVDNGSDYNKAGFSQPVTIEGREYSILQALGIHLTIARPYSGRSKTVERSFRDYSIDFDKRQPSYLGNSPATRPASAELYYTPEGVRLLPSLEQFCEMLRGELDRYHNTPRGGRFKGRTPLELWNAPNRLQRAPLSDRELHRALLLPLPKPRQVHRGGCVDIARVRYYAPELERLTGGKVIVKTSYFEPGRVHAFDLKGNYLAECTAQCTTHPLATVFGDDEDKRILSEQLVIAGRQRRELLDRFAETTGHLAGLSIEEIKTLTRADLESGKARVTVLSKNKVKAGDHNLKLVTTPAAAEAAATLGLPAPAPAPLPAAPRLSRQDEEEVRTAAAAIRAAAKPGEELDDISLAHQFLTQRKPKENDDEF